MNRDNQIAVIGGGPMGLAVAYQLSKMGYTPFVFESDIKLGGMAASFDFDGIELERYYHFHCLNDTAFLKIINELNLSELLKWKKTSMGFFFSGKLYEWGSFLSVLKFNKISLLGRFRYLLHSARCIYLKNLRKIDKLNAVIWLKNWVGQECYEILWEKLFRFKFYKYANKLSASWIWSRINRLGNSRKSFVEILGFIKGGSMILINSMADQIVKNGGKINTESEIISLQNNKSGGGTITTTKKKYSFKKIVTTIPFPILSSILKNGNIPEELLYFLNKIQYVACACVVLKLRKKVTNHFWVNINDKRFKIPGIIEMSNLRDFKDHIVYVPFYMPEDNQDYIRPDSDFIDDSWQCIKSINPRLKKTDLISTACNRYRYAQPICSQNYNEQKTPIELFSGIFIADTTSYFPDDRGISESVKFGRDLAIKVIKR